jgi:hypothetical protein
MAREFGPLMLRLGWRGATEARQKLDQEGRARLALAEQRLLLPAPDEPPWMAGTRALEAIFPGDRVVLHAGVLSGPPEWVTHNFDGLPSMRPLAAGTRMISARRYSVTGADPFANRPVNATTLLSDTRGGRRAFDLDDGYLEIMESNRVYHQLRMVLYSDRVELLGFVGIYRTRGEQPFDEQEHAILHALQPALTGRVELLRAVGPHPFSDELLHRTILALAQPAWLLQRGVVVLANGAAQALGSPPPEARRLLVAPRGVALDLVLAQAALPGLTPPGEESKDWAGGEALHRTGHALPTSLRQVYDLLTEGLTDKEIAQKVEVSAATARTYVSRVLKRLKVHSRRQLIRRPRGG